MSTSTRATGPNHRFTLRSRPLSASQLEQTADALTRGGVAIFPTETVYGMGASVFSRDGIQRIYQLKGRTWRKPLAILVHQLEAARPLVDVIPPEAARLADAFWPGPLTLVFKASALGRLVMGGIETIGVRIPDHPVALSILRHAAVPLATTSVNKSGDAPVTSGSAANKLFGAKVDVLIDGGRCSVKTPSSVVDLSHYPFTVIRAGAIAKAQLEMTLGLA